MLPGILKDPAGEWERKKSRDSDPEYSLSPSADFFSCALDDFHQHAFRTHNGFMQINLPVHKSAGYQKFFNGINSFFLYHQFSIMHRKHFDDPVITNHTFGNPGKKTISVEIIHPVHIQLTGYQLMQKFFWIMIGKNINGRI